MKEDPSQSPTIFQVRDGRMLRRLVGRAGRVVCSVPYWAQAHGQATPARFFRNDNLLAIGLFAPSGLLGAWLHRAARMQIAATKV